MGAGYLSISVILIHAIATKLEVFLQYDEAKVVSQRSAESVVPVGKWMGYASEAIAAAFVPGDERVADVDDMHLNNASTALVRPLLG